MQAGGGSTARSGAMRPVSASPCLRALRASRAFGPLTTKGAPMPDSRHHTEFFGPDLGRGPFTSNSPPVAAVQIATALAQPLAPLTRAQADWEAHAELIRNLADRLLPDHAEQIRLSVAPESSDNIVTTIREDSGSYSLLHC